jgi:hypothetical protein
MKNVLETGAEPSNVRTVRGAQTERFVPVDAGST